MGGMEGEGVWEPGWLKGKMEKGRGEREGKGWKGDTVEEGKRKERKEEVGILSVFKGGLVSCDPF